MPKESSNGKRRRERYNRIAKEFLAEYKSEPCPVMLKILGTVSVVHQVHHMRGRGGELMFDKRYFLAVSAWGHRWIHDHPEEAREHGWLVVNQARDVEFVK